MNDDELWDAERPQNENPETWSAEDWATAIKTYMAKTGLTADELAKKLEVSRATVYRWTSGNAKPTGTVAVSLTVLLKRDLLKMLGEQASWKMLIVGAVPVVGAVTAGGLLWKALARLVNDERSSK
jgi:ribosome-binding protein aMBF1 (putative translation factor)